MKIFISWSGGLSQSVANAFKDWLPTLFAYIDTYVSSEDIDKGTKWNSDIEKALAESSFGILCVTGSNYTEPWLNFEAGALSRTVGKPCVAPFLFMVKPSEIKEGPLLVYQWTVFNKADVLKLMKSINSSLETPLEKSRLEYNFDVNWPRLEKKLNEIEKTFLLSTKVVAKGQSDTRMQKAIGSDILEQLLELSRSQHRILSSPEDFLPKSYFKELMQGIVPPYSKESSDLTERVVTIQPLQELKRIGIVTKAGIVVRKEPAIVGSKPLYKLNKREPVIMMEKKGDFQQVRLLGSNITGWTIAKYIEEYEKQ